MARELRYLAVLDVAGATKVITFPDLEGCRATVPVGLDSMAAAEGALTGWIKQRIAGQQPVPRPSARDAAIGETTLSVLVPKDLAEKVREQFPKRGE